MAGKMLLEGVRVLSLEQVQVLPIGTAYLADLGADVFRVEHPDHLNDRRGGPFAGGKLGEQWWNESAGWAHNSRNKKSLSLNVDTPRGREIFLELVKQSDIVSDNFRTGTMQRLGLDHDSLVKVKPDIITLTCNAFGSTGPYMRYGARARTVDGFCGLSSISGYEDGPPLRVSGNWMDQTGGVNNAFVLLMAIYRKRKTGQGMRIDASMYETGIACIAPALLETQQGMSQARVGSSDPNGMTPYNVYPTGDEDRWIAITVTNDVQWQNLKRAMGNPAWAQEALFSTAASRWSNRKALEQKLSEWTKTQSHPELTTLLQRNGVPAGGVLNAKEVFESPQLGAREYFETISPNGAPNVSATALAGQKFVGRPFTMPLIPVTMGPGPDLGQHNRELLQGVLGMSDAELEKLVADEVVLVQPLAKDLASPPVPASPAAAAVAAG